MDTTSICYIHLREQACQQNYGSVAMAPFSYSDVTTFKSSAGVYISYTTALWCILITYVLALVCMCITTIVTK